MQEAQLSNKWRKILLFFNCISLFIGKCGGPLILRLYFIRGGKRIWFSSFLETAGWPVTLIPLTISYFLRRRNENTTLILMRHRLFIASAIIGLLTGLDDYLYAYGVAGLPVSTSSLVISCQLAFTALFAFLIVKQKFTAYSINAVVLLTMGSGVLAMNTKGDRPEGESGKMYLLGFILTLAAAVLYGAVLPMVELMYAKGRQKINFTLVMEIQTVISIFATGFCAVGMLLNGEFKGISTEARDFELGETKYYIVVTLGAILMQCFFLGAIGVIFCASSLFCGIISASLLPVTEFLAVIFYGEKFGAEKGVALALSIWGFISYFYGEINHRKNGKIESDQDQCLVDEKDVTERAVP